MTIPENFTKLAGEWSGSNRLFMSAGDPGKESASLASVGFEAKDKFLKINYDWVFDGKKQEGLMLFCFGKDSGVSSVWIDSWHQNSGFLNSGGALANNKISVKGNYTIPEYSDWGWRTDVEIVDENSFTFTMFNVSPVGHEDVAVEAKFERRN